MSSFLDKIGLVYILNKIKDRFIEKNDLDTTPTRGSNKPVTSDGVYTSLSGKANSSHEHGNISDIGTLQLIDVVVGNGDKLVVTDASSSSKIARASLTFDGSTTTQAISKKGTWESFEVPTNKVTSLSSLSTDTEYPSAKAVYDAILAGEQIQSDWNQTTTTAKDFIKNKPTIPTNYAVDYSKQYLTFVALEDGTFQFTEAINYSIDNGTTWTALAANTATPTITSGNKIMWKATLTPDSSSGIGTFSSTCNFNVEGNVMSLLYGDNFAGQTNLTGKDYAFYNLFYNCTKLINAKHVSLPAITLATYCYQYMFQNCTALTTAPELPATTLATYCYQYMFYDCTSLIIAPELPATTLTSHCYKDMFNGCTSLTIAPELPATTLVTQCYQNMFQRCTALISAPELPATTLVSLCYIGMFNGCTSLNYIKAMFTTTPSTTYTGNWVTNVASTGTFVKNSAAEWDVTGANGIPTGWNVYTDTEYKVVRHYELVDQVEEISEKEEVIATALTELDRRINAIPDSVKSDWNATPGSTTEILNKPTNISSFNNDSGYALLNSPAFIGTPTAPTQTSGDSSTQIATTAFVQGEISTQLGNIETLLQLI